MKKENLLNNTQLTFLLRNKITPTSIDIISKGVSNFNYLINNKYVLKCSYDMNFFSLSKDKVDFQNKFNSQEDLTVDIIDVDYINGFSLTKYLPSFKMINPSTINYYQIIKIVDTMKKYKSLKDVKLSTFNYNETLNKYRLMLDPKDRLYFKEIEENNLIYNELEISHLDLVDNNILFDKDNNIKIIDFEMVCLAFKNFDLVSLLSENNFNENINKTIIHLYFDNDLNKENEFISNYSSYCSILDLLWYTWAKARQINCPYSKKDIYQKIAEIKKERLLYSLSNKN
jgi:thiamine kinase-like enzyme